MPDEGDGPWPGIVQGPGWLGLHDAKLYARYHASFTEAGYAVFVFDYRGFGDSEGMGSALVLLVITALVTLWAGPTPGNDWRSLFITTAWFPTVRPSKAR